MNIFYIYVIKKIPHYFSGFILFILFAPSAFSQSEDKYDTVYVSATKTVVMVFPEIIKHVDVGNANILVDVVNVEGKPSNKLKLAAAKWLKESSLFVETETGMFTYIIRYRENPKLIYRIKGETSVIELESTHLSDGANGMSVTNKNKETAEAAKKLGATLKEIMSNAEKVSKQDGTLHSYGAKDNKVFWYLPEVYVKGDYFYFMVRMKNVSNINYDIDFIKLVIRSDKGVLKKNAVQEEEKVPEYVYGEEVRTIPGKSEVTRVIVVKKFTIDDGKKLFFELWEKGGERKIEFSLFYSDILNMKKLD